MFVLEPDSLIALRFFSTFLLLSFNVSVIGF